jgi:hypothetical protein
MQRQKTGVRNDLRKGHVLGIELEDLEMKQKYRVSNPEELNENQTGTKSIEIDSN